MEELEVNASAYNGRAGGYSFTYSERAEG